MPSRFRVLVFLILVYIAFGGSATIPGPCVTSIEETFGLSHDRIGLMFFCGSMGYILGVPASGWAIGALGLRCVMALVVGGLFLGLSLFAGCPAYFWAAAGHFITGFAGGLLDPASFAAIHALFPNKRREALNLAHMGFGLGAVGGPLWAKIVLDAGWSWRWVFGAWAALGFVALIILPRRALGAAAEAPPAPAPAAARLGKAWAARHPAFWLMFLAMLFYVGAEMGATSWASAFFETLRGLSKGQASLAPMWLWVGLSLGRLAMGFIGARISSRSILALASAVSLAFFLAALKAPTAGMAFACLALSGLGLGPIWPTILDHSANRLRTHDSRIMAVIILGGSFGGQAQALMGWIAEKHSLPAALGFAASMIACLLLCIALDIVFERMEARRARLSAAPH